MIMSEKNIHSESVTMPHDSASKLDKIYFFSSSSGDFSDELRVLDVTSVVPISEYPGKITEAFSKQVEKAGKDLKLDSSAWLYELKRGTFSSTMLFHDVKAGGMVVAELDMSILKHFGGWNMRFPEKSSRSSHDIEFRPLGLWKKDEVFVKDSIPYAWDISNGKSGLLHKMVDGQKILVAEFSAKTWFKNSCILILNTELLDDIVTLASCVAVLNR
jgi:hypothetical protein